jgi:hypothetical protein
MLIRTRAYDANAKKRRGFFRSIISNGHILGEAKLRHHLRHDQSNATDRHGDKVAVSVLEQSLQIGWNG